jgi:flagellar hook-associated protein 3 FlgL
MRITNSILQKSALGTLQTNLQQIERAQSEVSTGLRIQKASDDPTASASSMQASGSLRALAQYKRNVQTASARTGSEENALDQLTDILTRGRELATSQATSTASAQTRIAAKAEVDQLLQQAVQLGNTQFQGEYLFGGDQVTTAPFTSAVPPFVTTAPTGQRQTEISAGQYLVSNHNGKEIFLDTNALQTLQDLSAALGANDATAIQNAGYALAGSNDAVQNLVGDIGARSNQLQVTTANLDALDVNLRTLKSDLEEVDLDKAVTELVGRQNAYQAALLATSRVNGMNLTNYLR